MTFDPLLTLDATPPVPGSCSTALLTISNEELDLLGRLRASSFPFDRTDFIFSRGWSWGAQVTLSLGREGGGGELESKRALFSPDHHPPPSSFFRKILVRLDCPSPPHPRRPCLGAEGWRDDPGSDLVHRRPPPSLPPPPSISLAFPPFLRSPSLPRSPIKLFTRSSILLSLRPRFFARFWRHWRPRESRRHPSLISLDPPLFLPASLLLLLSSCLLY